MSKIKFIAVLYLFYYQNCEIIVNNESKFVLFDFKQNWTYNERESFRIVDELSKMKIISDRINSFNINKKIDAIVIEISILWHVYFISFKNVINLNLDLSDNDIKLIQAYQFSLLKVATLDLSHNSIIELKGDEFNGPFASRLISLDLSHSCLLYTSRRG